MLVKDLIKVLSEVDPETPISFMGAEGVIIKVNDVDKPHIIVEESLKTFNEAYGLDDPVSEVLFEILKG